MTLRALSGVAFALVVSACSGDGCGCALKPLPGGALPSDQTIEGGMQVRLTPDGLDLITSIVRGMITDSVSGGFCLAHGSKGLGLADVDYCDTSDGMCSTGCQVDVNVDSFDMSVPSYGVFRISTQVDASTDVHVYADWIVGGSSSCTLSASLNDGKVVADIGFDTDPTTGELTVELAGLQTIDLSGLSFSGCGVISDILNAVIGTITDVFASDLENYLRGKLEPVVNDALQDLVPDPLGIEGVADLTDVYGGFTSGVEPALELRAAPGGYVNLENGGISLGIITGINADADPSTRSAGEDSEAARCVPAFPAPDLAEASPALGKTYRGTFRLLPAGAFRGSPDPAGSDVVFGVSNTFLDLAGHHVAASGALCLAAGSELSDKLTLGTLGVLVPSLSELGESGDEPLLLHTRPTRPIKFSIGEGTEADPSLTAHIRGFEVDLYAFLFERYVRAFTLSLDFDVGMNVEFTTDDQGNPAILPTLVGLDTDNIGIRVLNEEFVREDRATLEAVLPTVFDLLLPRLADGFAPISLPEFAGFKLADLETGKVTTSGDDFLAIRARLGTSTMLRRLAEHSPSVAAVYDRMQAKVAPAAPARGSARLVTVRTPAPERVRAALLGQAGGAMPEVVLDLARTDEQGRELEWTWNLDGGMWRSFVSGGEVTLRDRAFALQGRYRIQLKSRVAGDYRTLSREPVEIEAVIDSVGPRIHTDEARVKEGKLVVPATDLVSPPEAVTLAFGRPGESRPQSGWNAGPIALAEARRLARGGRDLAIWARDEVGNESTETLDLDAIAGPGGEGQGGCSAGGDPASPAGSGALLGLLVLGAVGGRRRRRSLASRGVSSALLALVVAGGLSACGPGAGASGEGTTCEVAQDCASACGANQIPICADMECLCEDDVPYGRIGQYSDMAIGNDGAVWVSAYNSYHGDLVVAREESAGRVPNQAWEFVDGVPDGPVVVEDSNVRGGIYEPGEDVGLYTSVAVTDSGVVMVAYFDRDHGSLKLAVNDGGTWHTHTVDAGKPAGAGGAYEIAGQYTSIVIRASDQHPGIAYFAQASDGTQVTTEVRFAQATVPEPQAPEDWTIQVADSATVAVEQSSDTLTIPRGVGLFVHAARLSDGSPVLVYYDRIGGDLVLSRFDPEAKSFAAPEVLDGAGADVGWYPGIAVDENDEVHVSYVSASSEDLLYVNTADRTPELVDDGARIVEQTTEDGLSKREFHLIGDDSGLVMTPSGPVIAYQDATSHELMLARKSGGAWQRETIAGDEDPFSGGYGFYTAAGYDGQDVVMSSWVVDQPASDAWVEIFRQPVTN